MKTKETFLTIDPPSGWKYGFPKAVTQEQYKEIKDLKQWCVDNGYPKEEADSYGDYFCIQINGDLSFMNKKVICNHCGKSKNGVETGLCNHCGRFGKTTRQQALTWWNQLKYDSPVHLEFYAKKYFQRDWDTLTGREIEEIWKNEVQVKELSNAYHNAEYLKPNQKQYSQEENKKEYIQRVGRVNRKQFKQFDESLFKAYIDKFSNEDKLKMLAKLSCEISTVNPILNDLLDRISCYGGNK